MNEEKKTEKGLSRCTESETTTHRLAGYVEHPKRRDGSLGIIHAISYLPGYSI